MSACLCAPLRRRCQACGSTLRWVSSPLSVSSTSRKSDGHRLENVSYANHKQEYNPASGMESLVVRPISVVQAVQRAGRAGRTQPGFCFRLYTKDYLQHDMPPVTKPEIQRTSLVGAVLHLKSLALKIDVLSFDFLDPPEQESLADALRQLCANSSLPSPQLSISPLRLFLSTFSPARSAQASKRSEPVTAQQSALLTLLYFSPDPRQWRSYALDAIDRDGNITPLGRRMAELPLDPPLARAIIASDELGCFADMCAVAGMLSSERVFVGGPNDPDVDPPPDIVSPAEAVRFLSHLSGVIFVRNISRPRHNWRETAAECQCGCSGRLSSRVVSTLSGTYHSSPHFSGVIAGPRRFHHLPADVPGVGAHREGPGVLQAVPAERAFCCAMRICN